MALRLRLGKGNMFRHGMERSAARGSLLAAILSATVLGLGLPASLSDGAAPTSSGFSWDAAGIRSCTVLAASHGERVLFGNTEDHNFGMPLYKDPEGATVWFYPETEDHYGFMAVGWYWQGKHISFQGGMNDQGLVYDIAAVPERRMNPHPDRPFSFGTDGFLDRVLKLCATVEEAVDLVNQFDFETWWGQFLFADASGSAVVVGPGPDGEMAFTWMDEGDDNLVASQFNLAIPEDGANKDSRERYDTAVTMLEEVKEDEDLSVALFESILDGVHREKPFGTFTMYANIFDPVNRLAYAYYLSDFDEAVEFDLAEELAKGEHTVRLSEFVSPETRERSLARFKSVKNTGNAIGIGILAAIIMGSVGASMFTVKKVKNRRKARDL
jgi:hypothetical protein